MTERSKALCDDCSCTWMDDGPNPIDWPHCKLTKLEAKVRELEQWQRDMVEIQASGGKLDGYRELAQKCADLETRAETAEAKLAQIRELPRYIGTVNDEDVEIIYADELEARLSTNSAQISRKLVDVPTQEELRRCAFDLRYTGRAYGAEMIERCAAVLGYNLDPPSSFQEDS